MYSEPSQKQTQHPTNKGHIDFESSYLYIDL